MAIDTEMLRQERLGGSKTFGTDWDSGDVSKTFAAHAAIVGKNQVKERGGECPDYAGIDE